MLDAARVKVRFCCPGCGAGLRASSADAGTVLACHLCGEQVRIPRRPHPVECPAEDAPLIPPLAARSARTGCRLLVLGLVVLAAECAVLLTILAVLAVSDPDRTVLIPAGAAYFLLVAVRAGLKWFGYRRCEAAADAVEAAGFAAMVTPWLLGAHPTEPGPAGAVAAVGQVAWLLGMIGEFTVLLTWHRLLDELGGPHAARRVTVYTVTFAFAVLTVAAGLCLATMLTAARGHTWPPGQPHRYSEQPPEVWYGLCAVIALATAFAVVLGWQYYRILTATRYGLNRT